MSYLEELLPEFRKGAKIRRKCWVNQTNGVCIKDDSKLLFNIEEIQTDDWEIVPEKPIDYDYIISSKCLCWFWNEECYKYINTLNSIKKDGDFVSDNFIGNAFIWKNCRPVRRDEVTFYEDRKDE